MNPQRQGTFKPELSVVIPTFRLRKSIEITLRSLEAQTLDRDKFDVVFVDDGSDDGTADILESWRPTLRHRVLRNSHNRGRSVTRNRGWRETQGEVIVFLDGDMLAHPHLLEVYQARFASQDIDIVSGARWCLDLSKEVALDSTVLAKLTDHQLTNELFCDPIRDYQALRRKSHFGPMPNQTELEVELEAVCRDYPHSLTRALAFITSNVAVRREVLAATQGFMPLLARGEDTELGLQLAERGARFVYDRTAEAIHPFIKSSAATSDEQQIALEALLTRHPFKVVVLWWCWARQPGSEPYPHLTDIAHAETSGQLAEIDVDALARRNNLRLPAHFSITCEGLLSYWESVGRVPRKQLRSWLDQGLAQGLMHVDEPAVGKTFDFALTNSWLDEHSEWRQHLYRNSFLSHYLTRRQRGEENAPPLSVRWHVRYVMEIPGELIEGESSAVNLPLPIATRCQSELHIEECDPPDLMAYAQDGMIILYPVRSHCEPATIRLGYAFSCRVSEFDPTLREISRDEDLSTWLRPLSLHYFPALSSLLTYILSSGRGKCVVSSARKIYDWLLDNTEYRPNAQAGLSIVRSGIGNCIQLTRLYIALCRLAGIAARERCGLIIDSHVPGDLSFHGECRAYHSPFMHTWAEFHSPESGWTPVEMLPVAHGRRAVSPWNFPDINLRQRIYSEEPLFDSYYFGGLDPFRIHGSSSATMLPQLVQAQGDKWEPVPDPKLSIRHTVCAQGVPE